jgi:hypothetical protein
MSELATKIGKFNPDTRSVPVTFTSGEIVHKRDVNAMLKEDGSYDKLGTAARVEEVAQGVAHKIEAGVINMPKPLAAPEAEAAE